MSRLVPVLAAVLVALAPSASAYYHYVHYFRTAPFTPVYEKFDLNAIPNRTVHFYISDVGPTQFAADDSFNAVVSEIRAAARAWNDVETSELRLQFGGLASPGAVQSTPGIDVVFSDEIPPGLVAMGGPTTKSEVSASPNGSFVPIVRSTVFVRRDMTARPSYSEGFLLSVAHEFGHAIGLQHTLTSSVMSTEITRSTTKARPLAADDVAGISALYPARAFQSSTGTIAGRVTMNGRPVNLASVVALPAAGAAVSALTGPDGFYRIEGLPAGVSYYVYAHPLPPPLPSEVSSANINYPVDASGQPAPPSGAFDLQFFPNARTWQQAFSIQVTPGSSADGVNFTVQSRDRVQTYAVQTYGYPGQFAVKPPFISRAGTGRGWVVASGAGISTSTSVSVIGNGESIAGAVQPCTCGSTFVQFVVQTQPGSQEGPRHLLFTNGNESYVLPSAFHVAGKQPPALAGVSHGIEGADRVVTVSGTNISNDTRIWFDGVQATIRNVDEGAGRITVNVPPGLGGAKANMAAFNADGQSSLHLQSTPVTYEYEPSETPLVVVSPSSLPAGVESLVEVNGIATQFVQGQTVLGFGTSDIVVRQVWVLGPTRLLANVQVSPAAPSGTTLISLVTGLRIISQPFAFQVTPQNPRQLSIVSPVLNPSGGQTLSAGGNAVVTLSNAQTLTGAVVLVNDRPVQIVSSAGSQIVFQLPRELSPGPAYVRVQIGAESTPPVAISIDPPGPTIAGFVVPFVSGASTQSSYRPGDMVSFNVSNLAGPGTPVASQNVTVAVGSLEHTAAMVLPVGALHQVTFFLSPQIAPGQYMLTVSIEGRASAGVPFIVR